MAVGSVIMVMSKSLLLFEAVKYDPIGVHEYRKANEGFGSHRVRQMCKNSMTNRGFGFDVYSQSFTDRTNYCRKPTSYILSYNMWICRY